jgi:hypothetical protein
VASSCDRDKGFYGLLTVDNFSISFSAVNSLGRDMLLELNQIRIEIELKSRRL